MKTTPNTSFFFQFAMLIISCKPSQADIIIETIGQAEYDRLMALALDGFDQSYVEAYSAEL